MRKYLPFLLVVSACSQREQIALQYQLGNIDLQGLVRVETYIAVDPSDKREFFADQPYRSVAQGVGYEVRDFDGMGQRKVLITHDSTLGFVFAPSFVFTLLPPSNESAPPLVVSARAVGPSAMLGRSGDLPARFGPDARLTVPLSDQRCNGVACATADKCCANQCTNTLTDADNCGDCGLACGEKGDACVGGGCSCAGGSACGAGQSCCGGVGCIDLMADPFNCGSCGRACNPGETCSAGSCVCNGGTACSAGVLCCATSGCSSTASCPCGAMVCGAPNVCCDAAAGTCVDLMSDSSNCGACGHACPSGLSCQNGACKCNGQICSMGDTCCAGGCANLQSSTVSCGMCGHSCVPNEVCTSGVCKCGTNTCSAGQSCCGAACKNLDSDNMNCGSCGKACNAGEQCVSGACVCNGTVPLRGCALGETCCGGATSTSGCFDLSSDVLHCGSCSNPCGVGQACMMGMCVQTMCNPPCDNGNTCNTNLACSCGGKPACSSPLFCCGTSCVNKLTDPQNCGACGSDVRPNLCCGGVATPNDENNCGGCGKACGPSQLCCNVNGAFGCVDNNLDNCGACGNKCRNLTPQCCACARTGTCSAASFLCPPCSGGGSGGP